MFLKRPIDETDVTVMRIVLAQAKNKLRPEPSCDFCGGFGPRYIYASSHLSIGLEIQNWRWAACENCSLIIDHGELGLIENKLVLTLREHFKISEEIIRLVAQLALEEFKRYAVRIAEDGKTV